MNCVAVDAGGNVGVGIRVGVAVSVGVVFGVRGIVLDLLEIVAGGFRKTHAERIHVVNRNTKNGSQVATRNT